MFATGSLAANVGSWVYKPKATPTRIVEESGATWKFYGKQYWWQGRLESGGIEFSLIFVRSRSGFFVLKVPLKDSKKTHWRCQQLASVAPLCPNYYGHFGLGPLCCDSSSRNPYSCWLGMHFFLPQVMTISSSAVCGLADRSTASCSRKGSPR